MVMRIQGLKREIVSDSRGYSERKSFKYNIVMTISVIFCIVGVIGVVFLAG